jgi:hypothetical protein
MASYEVKTPVHHNGKKYKKGARIELTPKEAKAMPNAVAPVPVAAVAPKVDPKAPEGAE